MNQPSRPPPPLPQRPVPEPANSLPTVLALFFVIGIGLGFVALMMVVMPCAANVLPIFAVLGLLSFGFHYLVWGRLLEQAVKEEAETEDQDTSGVGR